MPLRPIWRPIAGIVNGRAIAQPQLTAIDTLIQDHSSMTAAELKSNRHALGLSAAGLARALKMRGKGAGRTVRRWEGRRYT